MRLARGSASESTEHRFMYGAESPGLHLIHITHCDSTSESGMYRDAIEDTAFIVKQWTADYRAYSSCASSGTPSKIQHVALVRATRIMTCCLLTTLRGKPVFVVLCLLIMHHVLRHGSRSSCIYLLNGSRLDC
jgi:hypothetical protein